MNDLILSLKEKKVYLISPHFDDAFLSCGTLLMNLSKKADVTVINVFTKAHKGPYTISAKRQLKISGFTNANLLYKQRQLEDKKVLSSLKLKTIDLKLQDALFRVKTNQTSLGKIIAEFNHYYPTYRWHIIKNISKTDNATKSLEEKLKKLATRNAVFIVPLGVGNHADHVIARIASEAIFNTNQIIYYSDFPYNVKDKSYEKEYIHFKKVEIEPDLLTKTKLINFYKTQLKSLFPFNKIPKHKEEFFINKSV